MTGIHPTRAFNWVSLGKAKAPVSQVSDFDQLHDALRFLESGDQVGQVILIRRG